MRTLRSSWKSGRRWSPRRQSASPTAYRTALGRSGTEHMRSVQALEGRPGVRVRAAAPPDAPAIAEFQTACWRILNLDWPGGRAILPEVVDGCLDRAVERGVGVNHLAEPPHRNPGVHGHGERAQDLAAPRAGRGGAHENPPLGILDQLDEAVIAGLVDPAPGGTGNLGAAHPDRRAPFLRLSLGQADRAD